MKSEMLLSVRLFMALVAFNFISFTSQAQINFEGLISQQEGSAAWNADGSGPEPAGSGHEGFLYFSASRDYVDPTCSYGAHTTGFTEGFPMLQAALIENGFLPEQLKIRMGLASLGEDQEGDDWFLFGNENYMNFYPIHLKLFLSDELMIEGTANYMMFHYGPSTNYEWNCRSNYFVPHDVSFFSSLPVQNVAEAFMQDVAEADVMLVLNTFGNSEPFSGDGREGAYFNFSGTLEKGRPELPFQGLAVNHEGFAGWDANGTGPEPKRNGHDQQLYYIASRDYDNIDPDPSASLARLTDENISGFQNFMLQLAYRGFSATDVKFKMNIRNIDEDIEGEDWYFVDNIHSVNFYHSLISASLNGEQLFGYVCDTSITFQDVAHPALGWWGTSAKTTVFNAAANSSTAVQAVAGSFFRDLNGRQIQTKTIKSTTAPGIINCNGRYGGFWQINDARLLAVPPIGTQVQPGEVFGHWTLEGHPYTINGEVYIPEGQTLEIDPGVWVKFTDRIHFYVDGAIQAIGDSANRESIVFTAVNPETGWGHLIFDSTSTSNPASVFKHCIFEYGSAPPAVPASLPSNCGGALAIREYSNVIIENCTFRYNRALSDGSWKASGGAIALWNSSPLIRNCIFHYNTANWSGGITCYSGSSPEVTNCLFVGNKSLRTANDGGGAMVISTGSNPVLLNNTFVNNQSLFKGGALEIYDASDPVLINNILWGNTAPQNSQIFISSGNCNVSVSYNNIEGGQAGIGPYGIGAGVYEYNLDTDPFFADPLAQNYQLDEGSPCIDTGSPELSGLNLPACDLLGNLRVWDGGSGTERIDMGPYEFNAPVYTGLNEQGDPSGKSELYAYPNPVNDKVEFQWTTNAVNWTYLSIYDVHGRNIKELINELQPAGKHLFRWNMRNLPSGIYFIRLQTGNKLQVIIVSKV
ncbi:MAG: right-handed parallel beta-helix repeat-containing protein [Bacteroidales bacterium]|nr:right-handed parallel beta-helix repeat-containing protein [Bacteroidales bacterium]